MYEIIQVGVEPEECAARWKSLRDKFVKELEKVKGGKSGMQDHHTSLLGLSSVLWSS